MNLPRLAAAILRAVADELEAGSPAAEKPAPRDEDVPPHVWNADPPLVAYPETPAEVDARRPPGFR